MNVVERPDIVEDVHLTYLDDLRDRGDTNMFGSAAYIQGAFGLTRPEAKEVVLYWMKSFGEKHHE